MKRLLLLALGTGLTGLAVGLSADRGQAQVPPPAPGPGPEGAVFKSPFDVKPAATPGANPTYIQGLLNQNPQTAPPQPGPGTLPAFAAPADAQSTLPEFQERPDPNKDIAVMPNHGPWMIFIESYSGAEAPMLARQMVIELRSTYRLPAYVFNHGAEERKKEYERVREIVRKQQEFIKQSGAMATPIRVRHLRIEEQCAVLVGGYQTDDEAKNALQNIRKLPPPDPKKVRLATWYYGKEGEQVSGPAGGSSGQIDDGKQGYVNPFKRAFVGRNPTVKMERPAEWDKLDLAVLKRLNRDESFSLLNCKKPVTLVIKQLNTPTLVQPKSPSGKFLEVMGLSGKGERTDAAAHSAHNLAEVLRKMNIDAYVLHTRFASIVTVGAFERADEPALQSMQHFIETRVVPSMGQVGLMPRPMPWEYRAAITGS